MASYRSCSLVPWNSRVINFTSEHFCIIKRLTALFIFVFNKGAYRKTVCFWRSIIWSLWLAFSPSQWPQFHFIWFQQYWSSKSFDVVPLTTRWAAGVSWLFVTHEDLTMEINLCIPEELEWLETKSHLVWLCYRNKLNRTVRSTSVKKTEALLITKGRQKFWQHLYRCCSPQTLHRVFVSVCSFQNVWEYGQMTSKGLVERWFKIVDELVSPFY